MTVEPGTRVLPASPAAIAAAARCLAAGGLAAFPTETVYGLGADARQGEAVARLYAAKGRPAFNPLIAHVADIAGARRLGLFNGDAERLAAAFWPGPLTLVLPKRPDCPVSDLALAGLDSVAVRVPAHPVRAGAACGIRRPGGGAFRQPLRTCLADQRRACARRFARPHRPHHRRRPVRGRSGIDDRVLPRRAGFAAARRTAARGHRARARTRFAAARRRMKRRWRPACWHRITRPRPGSGSMLRLYAPAKRCSHSGRSLPPPAARLNLSPRGDLIEAAANLFSHLRALDACRHNGHRRHADTA